YLEARPVLPHARRLVGLDVLAPLEPRQEARHLVLAVGWNDERDQPAPRLGGRVAVEALGAPVPARDHALERLADDRVVRRLDDGRQPRTAGLGLARHPPRA